MTQPKKTTTRRKTAQPVKVSPATVGTEKMPVPELPTCAELARIAAAMSSLDEDPKDTAYRAVNLWQACHKVIEEGKWFNEPGQEKNRQERSGFLAACELTFADIQPPFFTGTRIVPLKTFLKAISSDSKIEPVRAKWREFWKYETMEVIPKLCGGSLPNSSMQYHLPSKPDQGIEAHLLFPIRERFEGFLKETEKMTRTIRGEKGAKIRSMRAIAKAKINGQKLQPRLQAVLEGLVAEEQKTLAVMMILEVLLNGNEPTPKHQGEIKNLISRELQDEKRELRVTYSQVLLNSLTSEEHRNLVKISRMTDEDAVALTRAIRKAKNIIEDAKMPTRARPRQLPFKDFKSAPEPRME